MSGVLARLAQRALGGDNLRPRLSGTFGPMEPEEAAPESQPDVPGPTILGQAAPPPAVGAAPQERQDKPERASPPALEATPGAAPDAWRGALPRLPQPAAAAEPEEATIPRDAAATAPPASVTVPVPAAASPAFRPMLPPAPASRRVAEQPATRRPAPADDAPDINISIGSIEFRAPPQHRPASADMPPTPRLMSLEDYLATSRRGRR